MKKLSCVVVAGLAFVAANAFADNQVVNVTITDVNTTHNVSVISPRSGEFFGSGVGAGVTLGGAFVKGNPDTTSEGHKALTASYAIGKGQYTKFFFNVKRSDLFGWGCTIHTTAMPDGTVTASKGSEPTCKYTTLGVTGNDIAVTYFDQNVGAAA